MREKAGRILIVDDEIRIGKLIEKLIHWDELRMECLGVEDDPERAMELIRETRPEIVITDVRMPRVSGLDLVRMVREEGLGCKCLIVSGYRDFEYAQQAIRYEVDGYILKPVSEREINEALARVSGKLLSEAAQHERTEEMEHAITRSRRIISRHFINRMLDEEAAGAAEAEDVSLAGDVCQCLDIKLDYADIGRTDAREDESVRETVTGIVESEMSGAAEVLVAEKEYLHFYAVLGYPSDSAREIRSRVGRILSGIQDHLLRFENYVVTIGVGGEKTEFSDIRFSVREASRAAAARLRFGTGRLIYASSLEETERRPDILTPEESAEFTAAAESCDGERMERCIMSICSDLMRSGTDPCAWYELGGAFSNLLESATHTDDAEFRPVRERLTGLSQHLTSFAQMKQFFTKEVKAFLAGRREAAEGESLRPVRCAKQYIEEHFSEKIVLEDIAEIVGLNPVYFSVLFKEKTGENFSSYLLSVRMENAKRMLIETDETIAAIGEKTGYRDARYFSQTFAKAVGVKPALYRKLHS